MLLLEHHGKQLLASHGIAVPPGVYVASPADLTARELPSGPWVVKAQVATGGRGKAGAIRPAASADEVASILTELAGTRVKGKPIHGFRIEQRIDLAGAGVHEAYVSVSIDAETARIRLLVSDHGGVDIEASAQQQAVPAVLADPERVAEAAGRAADMLPPELRGPVRQAATRLTELFFAYEATLLEVNPLFVMADGRWIIGDVKLVLDDNAIVRQPVVRAVVEQHADAYPEAARKLAHGFDYVEIDPDGEIGLVTTGAGLSMKLIDELLAQGHRPLNFCDIRSGQFRGDPSRLIAVMRWIAGRPSVRVVLVNIFAGITDLGEFARLLVEATRAVPELRVPIVARLIGRNLDAAIHILGASGLAIKVEPDLGRALELTLAVLTDKGRALG